MVATKPQACVELSISVFPKRVSLSKPEQEFTLSVKAKTLSSSKPTSGILMNMRWSALDADRCIDRGSIFARSMPDESIHLGLAPLVIRCFNADGQSDDLSKSEFEQFVIAPALESGDALTVTHKLTVERLFKYAQVEVGGALFREEALLTSQQISDVKPDTKFQFRISDFRLSAFWWSFEDETKGKKLIEGILLNEWGFGLNSDDPEVVKQRESEGWKYSYPVEDLSFQIIRDEGNDTFTFEE